MKMILKAALLALVAVAGNAHAIPVSGQGTWETTLQARDLDGNSANGPEAFYDKALNISWLATGSATTGGWISQKSWAEQDRYGLSGWRLPTMVDTGVPGCSGWSNSGSDCGYNTQTTGGGVTYSEMGNLFYVTLGNRAYFDATGATQDNFGLSNTGNFSGLQSYYYWLGLEYSYPTDQELSVYGSNATYAWYFRTDEGFQYYNITGVGLYAMAVHDGAIGTPISPIPEPETYALMLAGLVVVGAAARRRQSVNGGSKRAAP